MTDEFAVYDVPTTCRQCGSAYLAKSFLPVSTEPRFGLCPDCLATDDAKMASLTRLPNSYPRPSKPERVDFRRRAAGDD